MRRVLLIGCGEIAMAGHLPALAHLAPIRDLSVVACDVDATRLAAVRQRFGFETVTQWESVARAGDIAVLTAPPAVNATLAVAALDAGLHVVCEKPPGLTLDDARAMEAAAQRHPELVNVVAFNRRVAPLSAHIMAAAQRFGPAQTFSARFTRASIGREPSNTARDWLSSDGIHSLDLAVASIGMPHSFVADRHSIGDGPANVWTIQLFAPAGAALLTFHFATGRRNETYEWAGAAYDMRLEFPVRAEWAQAGRDVEVIDNRTLGVDASYCHEWGFVAEHARVLEAVSGQSERPATDFAYGLELMRLVHALLHAPAGQLTELAPLSPSAPPAPERALHTPSPEGASVRTPTERRPIVVLHQPVSAQRRLFSASLLDQLAQVAEIRTAGDGDTFAGADVVVTGRGAPPIDGALEHADALKLVVVVGASVRNVNPAALLARGVVVANTADAVAQSVAEHCLLLALAGLRRLTELDRGMHGGGWRTPPQPRSLRSTARDVARLLPPPLRLKLYRTLAARAPSMVASTSGSAIAARDLRGQVVGLIGWGHTARHFARLLQPFGCELLVVSDALDEGEARDLGVHKAPMGEVLSRSHVVSLHKGLTPETTGLLGRNELDLLMAGSVLVNTARGPLVDNDALIARLARRDIVAALDVFDEEPLPPKHPIRQLSNVILTPHCASTTAQEEPRMGREAIETVIAWVSGAPVATIAADHLAKMT